MDEIVNLLELQIEKNKKNRSSSYKNYLQNVNYKNIYSQFSTGGFEKNNFIRVIFNFFFSRLIYGFSIFNTKNYKKNFLINKRLNVALNINIIWHLFVLKFLKKKIYPKNICVIGDGKANFIMNGFINFSNVRIFSINLPEVLINDYLIIKKSKILNKKKIDVIFDINQHVNAKKKLILIPAHLKNIINKFNIDLFVSIECFQELNKNEQNQYLKIISRQKNSYFYFLEREKKKLPGGEINLFKNFFPKNSITLSNEIASFSKIYYNTKFPFIHFQKKNKRHALVKVK